MCSLIYIVTTVSKPTIPITSRFIILFHNRGIVSDFWHLSFIYLITWSPKSILGNKHLFANILIVVVAQGIGQNLCSLYFLDKWSCLRTGGLLWWMLSFSLRIYEYSVISEKLRYFPGLQERSIVRQAHSQAVFTSQGILENPIFSPLWLLVQKNARAPYGQQKGMLALALALSQKGWSSLSLMRLKIAFPWKGDK